MKGGRGNNDLPDFPEYQIPIHDILAGILFFFPNTTHSSHIISLPLRPENRPET